MNDLDSSKCRSTSTPSSVKRTKTEYHDAKLACSYTPPPLPLCAPHGVERIPLPASLNVHRMSPRFLAKLANERIDILRRQGRRVVGLPVLLNDGIVLNWVRHSADAVQLHKVDDITSGVGESSSTRFLAQGNKLRLPGVSIGGGSGASAADAIAIDSDDDITGVSSLSRIDMPTTKRGTPLGQDPVDYSDSDSDSDVEMLSSENKAEDDPEHSHHSFVPLPVDVSDPMSLGSFSNRASAKEDAAASSVLRSEDTDATSDSESDGVHEEVDGAEDIDGSSAPHAKPPSLSSLHPIRESPTKRKQRDGSEHDILPERTIIASGTSKKQQKKRFHEEAFAITGCESEDEVDRLTSDPQLKRVPLPRTEHGRARRLLMPESAELPLVAVTMRGDCHFIERKKKYRISGYSLPNPGVFRHVGDACMVGNTAVLGCDKRSHQISFVSLAGKPHMMDVTWSPHCSGPRYQDMHKRGVSCLAAIHAKQGHIKFLSGGYDGTILKWTADIERLHEPRFKPVASHGVRIAALAYRHSDRSVMASAQKRLHITDLNRCQTMTHPVSNEIQQIHIHPQAEHVTLLEVRHLDRQIQLYDRRKGHFDCEPCLSFGQRSASGKFPGIHTRGSVHLVHFAMTSDDEGVLLWDFRNCKRAVIERRFKQAEKVVHTIFADGDVATFGQGVVTFFEDYLTL